MNCPRCGSAGPCMCSRSQTPARPRNTGNAPVYRTTPRSHAYSCRCSRCAPFYRQRSNSSSLITFDLGCLVVLLVFAAIGGIASWVAANHAAIVKNLPVIIGAPALLALIICVVVLVNRREGKRPPKGRLRVEATSPPDGQS
jgi:hypothetical protein